MSVFKRLGNVAKGKVRQLGRAADDAWSGDEPDELDPDRPPRPHGRPSASAAPAPPLRSPEQRRELLDRLLTEGLITQEEHAEKVAALTAADPTRPRPRRL